MREARVNHSSRSDATMVDIPWGTLVTMVQYKDRLAEAMKKSEMTATALATKLGVSYQAVKKVLDGSTRAFTAANNARAAALLKINPNWLATGQGNRDDVSAPMAPAAHSARVLVEQLVAIALPHRATLRKNLASLLADVLEHPEDAELVEQTITDIERFYA